ncbi:MAG: hypothetical protein HY713_05235 [candidate division NC10 bacterium]|nr:hypothetical protein [candidate division NC10 bacterium]
MADEVNRRVEIAPSQRKLKALSKLQTLSVKLSDGMDYHLLHHIIAGVTLDQVRQDLSGIRGSLADVVIDERAC